jgi:cell division protein FtsQ
LNRFAAALMSTAVLILLALGVYSIASRPAFAVRQVDIQSAGAPLRHVQEADLREALRSGLAGTTLTAALGGVREKIDAHPWVRQVTIRRIWPNRLLIQIEEHQPIASWGDGRFFNRQGELFVGETNGVMDDAADHYQCLLPELEGPVGSQARVLERAMQASVLLEANGHRLNAMALGSQYAWQLRINNGLVVEIGRDAIGTDWQVRLQQMAESLSWLNAQVRSEGRLARIDLRYANGYAYRLGSTVESSSERAAAPTSCFQYFIKDRNA